MPENKPTSSQDFYNKPMQSPAASGRPVKPDIKTTQDYTKFRTDPVPPAMPVAPKDQYVNVQSIPGNPLGVAGAVNPQIGDLILPGGSKIPNVILPLNEERPTGGGIVQPQVANVPAPVATPPAVNPEAAIANPPVVPGPVAEEKKSDPLKEAIQEPDFWGKVMDIAGKTGKTVLEIIGNFGRGLLGKDTVTEQRLAREHELRMQGNQMQMQKDLLSIEQGYNEKQAQLDRDLQTALNATQDENEKQRLKLEHADRQAALENERRQMANNLQIASLNKLWENSSKTQTTGGAGNFYNFGE